MMNFKSSSIQYTGIRLISSVLLSMAALNVMAAGSKTDPMGPQRSLVFIGSDSNNLGLSMLRAFEPTDAASQTNMVISPFGLTNILGTLQTATAGNTSKEISRLFNPPTIPHKALATQIKTLNKQVEGSKDVTIRNANRVWLSADMSAQVEPKFSTTLNDGLDASLGSFTSAEAKGMAGDLNSWVKEATSGHISSVVSEQALSKNVKAVAVNAVYFKSLWGERFGFSKDDTKPMQFNPEKGSPLYVPGMNSVFKLNQASLKGVDLIELPLANPSFSLLIMLPAGDNKTLQQLQNHITGNDFVDWLDALKPVQVRLQIPKFKIEPASLALSTQFTDLGVNQLFKPGADFSPMLASGALNADEIYHSAGIAIDEAGVEAASSSAAVIVAKNSNFDLPKVSVDRPFLFAIVYRPAATALFLGRVYKP
jgi:serine protease inhibitor